MRRLNKEEFMELELRNKLEVVNKVLGDEGTKGIARGFDFSYGWLVKRLKEEGAVYVQSDKKFVLREIDKFTSEEIVVLREMIDRYRGKEQIEIDDIRFFVGSCSKEITRSFTVDKAVNEEWTTFCKGVRGITSKDLATAALSEFIKRYKNV